ncbi:carboxypeptidase regulatory-like domain-containing protein [Methylobacter sp. YRD-M1]|uniref:carboxypeptidase regulatory-like domain-containing protein n=1 Tax=Methylobacter sp. YRD-M1 TaxID=2911520 RepID=UPI00227B653C|nr:carboxypeptidase regulatory-like domain-containing protein [Methylobacter sp. YRD-M1]WAK00609.1 carboxypeptidase regulatory-like domain-containing protein [Methylobacter sp. YRD-M1]
MAYSAVIRIILTGWLCFWGLPSVASITEGIQYLASQVQADGRIISDATIATPYQSTAESLSTLIALNEAGQSALTSGLQYLQQEFEPYQSTESASRLIIAKAEQGQIDTALITQLQSYQNIDGGFGALPGYASTVLDTAFAAQALALTGRSTTQTAGFAVNYLLTRQHADGSFALEANASSIFITALTSQTLQAYRYVYNVSDSIKNANNYLITQTSADGSIGEPFETALAVIAIAPVIADQGVYQASVQYLEAAQLPNSSWAEDVYTTALVLKALSAQQTASPPQPDKAGLAGKIVNGQSGKPLANVSVQVTTSDNQTSSTVTNAEGRYILNNLAPGSAEMHFTMTGFLSATATASLTAGETVSANIGLLANPQANPVNLIGKVIDSETSLALADAQIRVLNSAYATQTDSQGAFALNNIPAGSFTVEVVKQGYATVILAVSASAGGTVNLDTIALVPGGVAGSASSITGLISDAGTGSPLNGVLVTLSGADNQSVYSEQDGRFVFASVQPGAITVTASHDGYSNATGSATVGDGTRLEFNAVLVKASDPSLVTLQGKVKDALTLQPLMGASVSVNSGQTVQTDAEGLFYIGAVEPGSISLEFRATGYTTVSYTIQAEGGDFINLTGIALAPAIPVTDNQPPVIASNAPVSASVANIYEYHPQVSDPEGNALIFGLSDYPSGMEINSATGVIRWMPTSQQVGEQNFTLVVSDSQGAIAEQTATVTVSENSYPSYVVTDVKTLNSLTVNALLPNNYIVGQYITGGRSDGTWRASSSQGCGFSYYGAGGGSANITAAANTLDFWAMGSGYGSDAIWDLGEAMSTVTVLPMIDHGPFPQEGIEYTIWGSDDPDAAFPEGWTLATLVTIYSQGWADNAATCGNGVNIDDYAGLYTFGEKQFRYIRLKADNSITIFDTPEHTSFSSTGDDSGLAGWQSVESEIDGVVGMICTASPQADAGADILGRTGESIVFDATQSQGNIVTYGWDLDGDNAIDMTGATTEHIFNAGFDRDVKLFVVDDQGCVGHDTVHVTIGLNYPKPDLVVSSVDVSGVATNLQTLNISGSVSLTIANIGNAAALQPAEVTLFEDRNNNGLYDPSFDQVLGVQTMPSGLATNSELNMVMALNGTVLFRDSPVLAMVDSNQQIDEARENNNLMSAASLCTYTPPSLGDFDFAEKWYWQGEVFGPVSVAQITDDNNDGQINENDDPDVVFISSINAGGTGNLVAIHGNSGKEIWKNSSVTVTGYGSPAVGDIDNDGLIEIVIPNHDRTKLFAFEYDGTLKWTASTGPQFTGSPRDAVALADIDHDGDVEIIHGRRAYDHLGSLLWEGAGDYGGETSYGTLPVIADLDMQGSMELIAGRTAYRSDGSILWQRTDLPSSGGFTAIGNFNEDEDPEIVIVAGGDVYLLDNQGNTIWGPVSLPGGGIGGAPTVGDFDGDGEPEIGIAGASNYVVLETDGLIKWTSKTQDASSSRTGSSLFDFNLDGQVEVVYADELYLRVYEGSTGKIIKQQRLGSGTTLEYPVIADIDADGKAEIVVGSNNSSYSARRGLFAFEDVNDNWAPTRAIWNQHSYHINNVNDDGTIPQYEQPSWLSHNTYRLNTFADRDPTVLTDITASVLTIHNNGANQPASISVRIGNAGAGDLTSTIGIAFYEGDPAKAGRLLGVVPMDNLAKGTYQDVTLDNIETLSGTEAIYVIADYDNRLPECNEVNNRIMLPVFPQSSTGQIAVATDQLVYGPGSPVQLQSMVTNISAVPGQFKAELRVEDEQGIVVQAYEQHPIGPLPGGASQGLSDLWHTADYQAGTYRLRGLLYSLNGELVHEAVSAFEIKHALDGKPLAALRTTTDKMVYHTDDSAQVFNLVQNLAANQIIDNASLSINVLNQAGVSVFKANLDVAILMADASHDYSTLYKFAQAAEGTYTVIGELKDKAGAVLATDQAQFEVKANLLLNLQGKVEVNLPSLDKGRLQVCTDTFTYVGNNNLLALPIRQIVVNLDTEEVVNTTDTTVDLLSHTPYVSIRDVVTDNLATGNYACLIQGEINAAWVTLAHETFVVSEPPINIQTQLGAGERGRVLVLLDEAPKSCDGYNRVGMEASISTPLTTGVLVTAILYDQNGAIVDQETGLPDERLTDQNPGSGGINLILNDIAPNHIAASVSAATALGQGYRLTVSVDNGTETFDSGLIATNCQDTLRVGAVYGDFRLTDVLRLPAANDPLGPNHIPDLASQRTVLETLLSQAGWSYTITTNADDFTRELRSGGYVSYLLLSEQVKLDEAVQKELREAVYRGEGLVEAGSHDQRQGRIDDILGIKFLGKQAGMSGITVLDSGVHKPADALFSLTDRMLRAKSLGAEILGKFSGTEDLAMTTRPYGSGRADYFGFDLLAEAAMPGADPLYADLLLGALEHVHPDTLKPYAGGVYPLQLRISNQGIATAGQAIITLPAGIGIVNKGTATLINNMLVWPFELIPDQTLTFDSWISLPAEPVKITALIQTGVSPDFKDYKTVVLDIAPQATPALEEILINVQALDPHIYKQVIKYLKWAIQDQNNGDTHSALTALIRASDALIDIGPDAEAAVRLQIAEAMRTLSQKL